jgi:hypothetical protein
VLQASPAPGNSTQVCRYGNSTTQLSCIAVDEPTCSQQYVGVMARGSCEDTDHPCDIGACCGDPLYGYCHDNAHTDVRGSCHSSSSSVFFQGEICNQSCSTLSLGACCRKDTPSSAATCTVSTYKECATDINEPNAQYMGFAWNKTCAEVDCARYGACCHSERMYDGVNCSISWFCRAGCFRST